MRVILIMFILCTSFAYGQQKKRVDVVSNIETRMIAMKPLGNNHLAELMAPFYGFGFGGNLMTPINFGVGLDVNMLFSNVKYGSENRYGHIGSPTITNMDVYVTHRDYFTEELSLEEMAGFSYYRQTNLFIDGKDEKFKNNATGFNAGGKLLYDVDREGYQQVFLAAKVNFYFSNIYNENQDIKKFYNHSTFLSLNVGYRYNF